MTKIVVLSLMWWPTFCIAQQAELRALTPQNTKQQIQSLPRPQRFELLRAVLATRPNADGSATVTVSGAQVTVDPAAVKEQAKADGTYSTFGAVFDVSGAFGDAGSGAVPSAQTTIQSEAIGIIKFESAHYWSVADNDKSHHPDLSFGGTIGLYPTLVLENLSSATATISAPNARPMFQDAFRWSLGPNLNIPIFDHGEASVFTDLGQNFLVSETSSFKQGSDSIVATPVNNNAGRAAMFWEGGIQMRLLNVAISQAHSDKQSFLLPGFQIATGYRRDNRFNKSGDLETFDNPTARFFLRFFVSLNNILDQRTAGKPNQPMSFKFGIDYEKPISDNRVPSATRYLVSADVDILKLFRPSSTN
jgi:hypothetical protein